MVPVIKVNTVDREKLSSNIYFGKILVRCEKYTKGKSETKRTASACGLPAQVPHRKPITVSNGVISLYVDGVGRE